MTQEDGRTGPAQDDYWEQEVTLTRAQLQGERDAWYENGLRNGSLRALVRSAYETSWLRDKVKRGQAL